MPSPWISWWLRQSACNVGDWGLIPGLGRSPGWGQPTPAFLPGKSPWTREPGWATVSRVSKSRTQLSDSAQHSMTLCVSTVPGEYLLVKRIWLMWWGYKRKWLLSYPCSPPHPDQLSWLTWSEEVSGHVVIFSLERFMRWGTRVTFDQAPWGTESYQQLHKWAWKQVHPLVEH